ncbi:MAG: PQQ-binding-like beta-propeller repeat protein [Planctomycetota bacterium]
MQFAIPFVLVITALVGCAPPELQSAGTSGNETTTGESHEIAAGEYNWPRFLGEGFDGTGVLDGLKLDLSAAPTALWQLSVGEGYGLGCVNDGKYYQLDAVAASERLRCVSLRDASEIWSVSRPMRYRDLYDYESGPRTTPAIDGEVIVTYGVDGALVARELQKGTVLWEVDTATEYGVIQNFFGVGSSPLIVGQQVIVSVGGSPAEDQAIAPGRLNRVTDNGTAVVSFDLKTGKENWRCGNDLASYSSPRLMTVNERNIVLLYARDHLLAIDPEAGRVLWKYRHRAKILESVNAMMPVVDGDKIFISECYQLGSALLSADASAVQEVWKDPENRRKQVMRCHWSTPILINGMLYGCSGRNNPDSSLRCIDFQTGDLKWSDDRQIRTSMVRAGDALIVLDERGRMQMIDPNPEKLTVIAEHDFSNLLTSPCWAAPVLVGNRLIVRGDEQVVCFTLAAEAVSPRPRP